MRQLVRWSDTVGWSRYFLVEENLKTQYIVLLIKLPEQLYNELQNPFDLRGKVRYKSAISNCA